VVKEKKCGLMAEVIHGFNVMGMNNGIMGGLFNEREEERR
jgi:hypothetical protein